MIPVPTESIINCGNSGILQEDCEVVYTFLLRLGLLVPTLCVGTHFGRSASINHYGQ